MLPTLDRLLAVTARVLRQLSRDHRFLGLTLVAPLILIFLLKAFFDSLDSPLFEPTNFIVPVGAFIVHFLTYILCAIGLVRERTAGTLSRMFISGYRQVEIIGGFLLAYTTLATLQSLLVLVELSLLFDLKYVAAQYLSIYLVIWLLAVISTALGIFVSTFARNEGQVIPFIPLVALPSVFLSGLIIAVERLPTWAQWLGLVTPLYYANHVLQRLIQPDGALSDDWTHLIALPVYGLVVLFLATRTLQERD